MKTKTKILFLFLALAGITMTFFSCGPQTGEPGRDGVSTVLQVIQSPTCAYGGITVLTAKDTNFNMKLDSRDSDIQSADICNGADGKDGVDGTGGVNGNDGHDGTDGKDGVDGTDGNDGTDGKDADNEALDYTPVAIVDPCGDAPGIIDEVLLKLGNGTLLSSVSDKKNGENTRLSVLIPGTYEAMDDSKCIFTISPTHVVSPL